MMRLHLPSAGITGTAPPCLARFLGFTTHRWTSSNSSYLQLDLPESTRAVFLLLGSWTPSSRFPCWKSQFNLSLSICQTLLPRIKLSSFDLHTFNGHHRYLRPSVQKCGYYTCPQHTLGIQGLPAPCWLCLQHTAHPTTKYTTILRDSHSLQDLCLRLGLLPIHPPNPDWGCEVQATQEVTRGLHDGF